MIAQDGLRLFNSPCFEGFGPSRFQPEGETLGGLCLRGKPAALKLQMKQHAPKCPGVYAMLDPRGRIIYVGKAKCLRTRLACYFRTDSRNPKAAKIIRQTRTLLWEHCPDELSALLRELELIQRHRPRFNVLGLPGLKRYCYLALGRPAAPYAYVTREPSKKDIAVYGPFVGRRRVEEAVRRLNDYHGLRDCAASLPMAFAESPALFDVEKTHGCLRYDLGTCLGPCGGGCTRGEYHAQLRKVRQFLDGTDRTLLTTLKDAMTAAAAEQRFEKAGAIRDRLADLEWLDLRLALLRRSRRESAFIYPVETGDGRGLWFLLNRGRVWGTIRPPNRREELEKAVETIQRMLAETTAEPVTVTSVDSVLLLLAWFRKHSGEKARLVAAEAKLQELRAAIRRAA